MDFRLSKSTKQAITKVSSNIYNYNSFGTKKMNYCWFESSKSILYCRSNIINWYNILTNLILKKPQLTIY